MDKLNIQIAVEGLQKAEQLAIQVNEKLAELRTLADELNSAIKNISFEQIYQDEVQTDIGNQDK